METASHSPFIKPFIALMAMGGILFWIIEQSGSAYVHLTALQWPTSLKAAWKTKQMTSSGLSASFLSQDSEPGQKLLWHMPF